LRARKGRVDPLDQPAARILRSGPASRACIRAERLFPDGPGVGHDPNLSSVEVLQLVRADESRFRDRRAAVSTLPGQPDAHPRRNSSTDDDAGDPEVAEAADPRATDHAGATGLTGLVAGRTSGEVLPGQLHRSPGRLTARAWAVGHGCARDRARRSKSLWPGALSG